MCTILFLYICNVDNIQFTVKVIFIVSFRLVVFRADFFRPFLCTLAMF